VCLATRHQETPLAKYSSAVVLITDTLLGALFEQNEQARKTIVETLQSLNTDQRNVDPLYYKTFRKFARIPWSRTLGLRKVQTKEFWGDLES